MMKSFLLSLISKAYAAPATSGDAIISKPAGTGILPGAGVEGSDIQSSVLFSRIIPFLIQWAINLAMALAVIAIIFGGYMYLTAYGDTEKRERGTRTLIYAVIGLVIALTAYGVVAIVTSIRLS
ncbi:hypothetical protein JXD20_04170 [Candidatus Peregrinibacteria bacterium]|nr:hypothetical protein [Candidatus Peregrinibacteria bacterium]